MATPPRVFEENAFYHVYNRGVKKQQIFLENRDYKRFLDKAVEYKKKYPVKIISFCLMPNHFHFLIQQLSNGAISNFFSNLCNSHSKYYNIKYESVGSLFQGRFKAKKIDSDEYLIHLSRYIHLNPTSLLKSAGKGLFDQLQSYSWSSLPLFLSASSNDLVDTNDVLTYFSKKNPVADYREFVSANITIDANPLIDHLTFSET